MKVFVLYARERWITDELAKEWIENNGDIYTTNLDECDTIWILSDYITNKIPFYYYRAKRVITTIHHITPWKVTEKSKKHFEFLNDITDVFHSICENTTKNMIKFGFKKPIRTLPFWHNENVWTFLNDKINLRNKYNISEDTFLVGSFQKDTESASVWNGTYLPKLEKGPDLFVKAVVALSKKHNNLKVLLTGYYRQYIMRELDKVGIKYIYFERANFEKLNELYNILDLYVVASRVEGGPRAINECALTQTPIYSTNVGIASKLLSKESLFYIKDIDSILKCSTNTKYSSKVAEKYKICNFMRRFTREILER